MHITSLAYSDTPSYAEKRAAKDFFNAMVFLLPCPVCREHFRVVIQEKPVENWLDNRKSLIEWVWMAHNSVNRQLGKAEVSMNEFMTAYSKMAARGLPIPPAAPTAELSEAERAEAWAQGVGHTVAGAAVIITVGGLLWVSYNGKL
jgi:hypothetical protein